MISKGSLVRWKCRRRARGSTGGPHYNGIYLAISDSYDRPADAPGCVIDILLEGSRRMIYVHNVEEVQ